MYHKQIVLFYVFWSLQCISFLCIKLVNPIFWHVWYQCILSRRFDSMANVQMERVCMQVYNSKILRVCILTIYEYHFNLTYVTLFHPRHSNTIVIGEKHWSSLYKQVSLGDRNQCRLTGPWQTSFTLAHIICSKRLPVIWRDNASIWQF